MYAAARRRAREPGGDNTAAGNHKAGFYVGESPHADAVVSGNSSHGNGLGIFFRDSRGGWIADNSLTGNCAGMLMLNTGLLPSGVGDATAVDNDVNGNNLACPSGDGPPPSGLGIVVAGGDHINLRGNTVNRNVSSTPATAASGGIVLIPSAGTQTNHTTVRGNSLSRNSIDILVAVPLATNTFADNDCRTSSPAGLCTH